MNILKSLLILTLALGFGTAGAQTAEKAAADAPQYVKPEKTFRYRVYLTDKENNPYSLKRPEEFLSKKALARRKKFGIKVDWADLPVTPDYVAYLQRHFGRILHVSKWNNTAVIETTDSARALTLPSLTFVREVKRVWESRDSIRVQKAADRYDLVTNSRDTLPDHYGHSRHQVNQIAADSLHALGFTGEGITIAVIDGGFLNADTIAATKDCRILGTKNFTGTDESVYEAPSDHGTMVLSCIGTNMPGCLIGTAPGAQFYLLQSEDVPTEHIVEEDNWCAALEYADSVGVDIVTSSLGYNSFDDKTASHTYAELDGRTAINSRSASMAASRGLVVLNSAGNSGNDPWKKIGFPADAWNILTVGAVTEEGINTNFSSVGNSADGRIKPDVMAMGQDAWLVDAYGNVTVANGTSFSCPIMCGGVACLMQAFPKKTPMEIMEAVRIAGHNAEHPDNIYGYGIPDLLKAYRMLKKN